MNQLPCLHQATFDSSTLESLFRDIATFGSEVHVVPKHGPRRQVGDASMTLAEAHAALLSNAIRAAQVRYSYEGGCWCDTLCREANGWRLTRINLTEASA